MAVFGAQAHPVLPHSWHLDPCKYTSPTRPIKVATRTRQDDARPTGKDRVLLSRGSLVRGRPRTGRAAGRQKRRSTNGRHRTSRGRLFRPPKGRWRGGWYTWVSPGGGSLAQVLGEVFRLDYSLLFRKKVSNCLDSCGLYLWPHAGVLASPADGGSVSSNPTGVFHART